jgi:hypothetical protein
MNYFWQSIKTRSYWKYALLSTDAVKTFFAVLGAVWLLFEMMDFFKLFDPEKLPVYSFFILIFVSLVLVICTRRPISRIRYKVSGKDLQIEVRIGNLFDYKGQKVISTNTTFDTDIANGVIAAGSLQGQFTNTFYPQQIQALDQILDNALVNIASTHYPKISGKDKKYPMGTTVRINIGTEIFYLLAMSDLNFNNTAQTTLDNVLLSTNELWQFIIAKGENEPIVLPLIGTGRGRISTNRKNLIAQISQSFIKASEQNIFSNKLIVVIHPTDVENFDINLFEVKDLLNHYLA